MEVKLQQQLAWVEQEPLYQIYLDLRKAHDALDQARCLEILAGYGVVGPNLLRLQKQFWAEAKMVCCAGDSYGEPFGAFRGVTQGGPLSSLMVNVCVDCVVREWLQQVLGDDATRDDVKEAMRDNCIVFFIARCPVWLQSSFHILIKLFKRIGLLANLDKTKVVTVCRKGYELPGRRWNMPISRPGTQQHRSIIGLNVKSVAPASRLDPSEATWRPSTTSSGRSYSTGTSSLHALQRSTVLLNCSPPASTSARCHSVEGKRAPGTIYADISSHDIPRILFAFRPRAPNPYQSVINVDCRRRWRTSIEATIKPSCVRGGGRGSVNMRLPCVPSRPWSTFFVQRGTTGKSRSFQVLGLTHCWR